MFVKSCTRTRIIALIILAAVCIPAGAVNMSQSIELGYLGDIGGSFKFRLGDLSEALPFYIDFGIGYIYQFDSGNATDARRIFINDNTGGVIEKHGESFVFSIDVGYPFEIGNKGIAISPYLGPRYNRYKAYYAFIGNNEAFNVMSNQWGLGAGLRVQIPISNKGDFFFLNGGAEYYFKAPLLSHGTYYYNPDGIDDRPRTSGTTTFTYDDADAAVNQPRFRPIITLGVLYSIR